MMRCVVPFYSAAHALCRYCQVMAGLEGHQPLYCHPDLTKVSVADRSAGSLTLIKLSTNALIICEPSQAWLHRVSWSCGGDT